MSVSHFLNRKITWTMMIATISVVLTHAHNLEIYHVTNESWLGTFTIFIESCCQFCTHELAVPIFFVISAYLFYYHFTWTQLKNKWQKRWRSLVIPYLAWNTLYFFIFLFLSFTPWISNFIQQQKITAVTLSSFFQAIFLHLYNPVYWFIAYLIIFIFLAPAIYFLLKNKTTAIITLITVWLLATFWSPVQSLRPLSFFYYLLGAYTAIHAHVIVQQRRSQSQSFLAVAILFVSTIIGWKLQNSFWHNLCLPIGVVSFWFALDLFTWPTKDFWWLHSTFFIYSAHYIILKAVIKILFLLTKRAPVWALVNFFLAAIITIVLCLLTFYWLQQSKWQKFWLFLNGGRGKNNKQTVKNFCNQVDNVNKRNFTN